MIEFGITGWQLLQFVVAIGLPVLVGLVTTRLTDPGLKATLLLALSVVSSLLTELLAAVTSGQTYDLGTALLFALGTFVTGTALHYGLWKPTGVSGIAADTLVKSGPEHRA